MADLAIPPTLAEVPCNLCGSKDSRVRFFVPETKEADGSFRATTDVYGAFGRIVECTHCRLVYTNPRPAAAELLADYAATEDAEYVGEDSSRSINAYFSLHTIQRFVREGRLLDVGCSTGYFLNAARINFEPTGVEPSHWAAEFARRQLHLNVTEGSLETAQFPSNHFDVVTLSDVIEHLPDPLNTLREVHRILRPGGWIYVVTPDIASITARLMGKRWWGLRPAHIYYFSQETLKRMLESAGFRITLMQRFGRAFSCGYWQSRLRHYSSWVNRFLQWIITSLGISHKLVYINTMDSMECCAQKPVS